MNETLLTPGSDHRPQHAIFDYRRCRCERLGVMKPHDQVLKELRSFANPDKATSALKFFRTGPGEYGEGDRFLGVTVPEQRMVARSFRDLPIADITPILQSPWHEMRLTALLILVNQFQSCKRDPVRQQIVVDFYLNHLDHVNNWDLVDSSAPKILGAFSLVQPTYQKKMDALSKSKQLWRERIAVVATQAQIQQHQFHQILVFAERLLKHPHDLMHKAIGWMLREMGQKDLPTLLAFLDQHAAKMPRTMLRYAIEKLGPRDKEHYMLAKQREKQA